MASESRPEKSQMLKPDFNHARRRVREEAEAAANATCLAATLIHVNLAIAYAKRCG